MSNTPGPWRVVDNAYGEPVLVADQTERVGVPGRIAEALIADDAMLIAAAPDMLEVLREVAEHFADTDAPLGKKACAAINKALLPSNDGSK